MNNAMIIKMDGTQYFNLATLEVAINLGVITLEEVLNAGEDVYQVVPTEQVEEMIDAQEAFEQERKEEEEEVKIIDIADNILKAVAKSVTPLGEETTDEELGEDTYNKLVGKLWRLYTDVEYGVSNMSASTEGFVRGVYGYYIQYRKLSVDQASVIEDIYSQVYST